MRILYVLVSVVVFLFCSHGLHAEYVYLRDGKIIEGTVVKKTRWLLYMKVAGKDRRYSQKFVLRIRKDSKHLGYYTLTLKNGTIIKGYLVAQSARHYVLRKQLNNAKEIYLEKRHVRSADRQGHRFGMHLAGGYYLPQGNMGKLFKPGYGAVMALEKLVVFGSHFSIGLQVGYYRMPGNKDTIEQGKVMPAQLLFGYHIRPMDRLSIIPHLLAGATYITVNYNNGTYDPDWNLLSNTNSAFELTLGAGLNVTYAFGPVYALIGGEWGWIKEAEFMDYMAFKIGVGTRL